MNKKTGAVKLPKPIIANLGSNGGKVSFDSFEQVSEWAKVELKIWRDIFDACDKSHYTSFNEAIIGQQLTASENLVDIVDSILDEKIEIDEAVESIVLSFDSYSAFCTVHSNGVLGQMIVTMKRYLPMVFGMLAGASASAKPESANSFNVHADAESFIFGYALALQFRSDNKGEYSDEMLTTATRQRDVLEERIAPSEDALARLNKEQTAFRSVMEEGKEQLLIYQCDIRNNLQDTKESIDQIKLEIKQETDSFFDDVKVTVRKIQQEYKNEVNSFKKAFQAQTKVRASVDYWTDVAKLYSGRASQATSCFILFGLVSMIIVIATAYALTKSGVASSDGIDVITLATLGLPIFISVVLLRMIVKTRSSYEILANDAFERVAMIETFIALEAEGKAEDRERIVMLQALFRPVQSSGNEEGGFSIDKLTKSLKGK